MVRTLRFHCCGLGSSVIWKLRSCKQSKKKKKKANSAWWVNAGHRVMTRVCMLSCPVVSSSLCPMDCSPPGFSVPGIFQARILEWVAIPFSRDLPDPGIEHVPPVLAGRFVTNEPPASWQSSPLPPHFLAGPWCYNDSFAWEIPWKFLIPKTNFSMLEARGCVPRCGCRVPWTLTCFSGWWKLGYLGDAISFTLICLLFKDVPLLRTWALRLCGIVVWFFLIV